MTTICLNMIVKNEAAVIERCLDSVIPWIGLWTIVDTGSTDGTQDIIRNRLRGIPGKLIERPWLNFGHNRTEAFRLATASGDADYLLLIDADETLLSGSPLPYYFTADAYEVTAEYGGGVLSPRIFLASTWLRWEWKCVLHEYPQSTPEAKIETLPSVRILSHHDGARGRDPDTLRKDIEVLQRALVKEPSNARYRFYLAQSYRDAGELDRASTYYHYRSEMPGTWEEERWYARYQAAKVDIQIGEKKADEIMWDLLRAFEQRPTRAEPLVALAAFLDSVGLPSMAKVFSEQAARIPYPKGDRLFIEKECYK